MVIHIERYVGVIYLFGRPDVATPELTVWFAYKLAERMRPPKPEATDE